jgi:hypothetical protein
MVFYFKSRCGEYTLYMGRDKYENESLIKYGLPEDVWFHVDDLSSAHVYLRMKPGQTLDDISDDLLLDCASLVKANSIAGCKVSSLREHEVCSLLHLLPSLRRLTQLSTSHPKSSCYVIYTRWKNLKRRPAWWTDKSVHRRKHATDTSPKEQSSSASWIRPGRTQRY